MRRLISLTVIVLAAAVALPLSAPAGFGGGRQFFNNDRKFAIPDEPNGGGKLSKITLTGNGRIADLDVGIRINHRSVDDLNIYLISPQGNFVELSTDNGGPGDHYGTGPNSCGGSGSLTIFSDEAGRDIRAGNAPFPGPFRPQTRLGALDGQRVAGTWRLQVFDDEIGTTGVIGCFALGIKFR